MAIIIQTSFASCARGDGASDGMAVFPGLF